MTVPAHDHDATNKEQAINWLIRLSAEHCPDGERQAFERWLRQSPGHRAAYDEITRRMDWLERVAESDTGLRNAALRYRAGRRKPTKRLWLRLSIAASLLLIIGVATFSPEGWYGTSARYQVARGGHDTVELADGSRLELNTDSEVEVRINRWQRTVEVVKGEVFFSVTHDADKPFVVTAGAGRSIDLGTEFNVYRQADRVIVAVQEGKVRVEAKQSRELTASQAVAYNRHGDFIALPERFDLAEATAWRRGKLIFDKRRLGEVLAEMARYHRIRLYLADRTLADLKVSGTFFIDRLDSNLALIADSLNLAVHPTGHGEIVIVKR